MMDFVQRAGRREHLVLLMSAYGFGGWIRFAMFVYKRENVGHFDDRASSQKSSDRLGMRWPPGIRLSTGWVVKYSGKKIS